MRAVNRSKQHWNCNEVRRPVGHGAERVLLHRGPIPRRPQDRPAGPVPIRDDRQPHFINHVLTSSSFFNDLAWIHRSILKVDRWIQD